MHNSFTILSYAYVMEFAPILFPTQDVQYSLCFLNSSLILLHIWCYRNIFERENVTSKGIIMGIEKDK